MDGSQLQRFAWGFGRVGHGAGFLIRRPRLYPWVIAPAVFTIIMIIYAWYASWAYSPLLLNYFWPRPIDPGLLQNLWNSTALVVVLLFFASAALIFYGLMGAFGAPFYDLLAGEVEREVSPERATTLDWAQFARITFRSIAHSLMAFGLWIGVLLVLMLFSLVPVIGSLIDFVGSVGATALFLSREMMDGTMSRRELSFAQKVGIVGAEPAIMLGFGFATSLLLFIPLVNFLSLPISVVGGTLLFLTLEEAGRIPD